MKKQLFILFFLVSGIHLCQAQDRVGIELKFVPVSLQSLADDQDNLVKVREYPQLGYYYQRWLSDRRYLYRRVAFQYTKLVDQRPVSEYREDLNILSLYSGFGRGFYLNHREFEDDFAFYVSYGIGCGIAVGTYHRYMPGSNEVNSTGPQPIGTLGFEGGFGFEKSLNRKWVANCSIEAHAVTYNPLYIGITARFLYRRY